MHQGMVVASFSMGRILSSPLLGTFSELYGYLPVLVLANCIIALGCLGYALADTLPYLVLAQVVIGFGSGT
jgi:MFS family permease